jgi:hypothetical protein
MVGSVNLALFNKRGRRNAERRTLVTAAACFPDCRKTEAHGNASQRSTAGLLRPWDRSSGRRREQARHPGRLSPALRLSRPATLVAAPRSGHGRLPKAPRVRGARPPRPQAPHPAPRYKRPGNAPQVGRDRNEFSIVGRYVKRRNIKFSRRKQGVVSRARYSGLRAAPQSGPSQSLMVTTPPSNALRCIQGGRWYLVVPSCRSMR